MEFADSHCHLDDAQFDDDRTEVIQRAREAGLKYLLSIGTGDGPPDLEAAVRLAEQYSFVFATAGVHPNDAPKADVKTFTDLELIIAHPKVRALGEIGLDYHWGVPKEVQLPVFLRQLEIASAAKLPIVIHTRDAWKDTLDTLRQRWAPAGLPCIMHCFTGTPDQARECLDLGFHLGFGGVSTFPKASDIREAARITPIDRLLLETDCPYLAPVPYRGKRNEPAYLVNTAEGISRAVGVSLEELGAHATRNLEKLLKLQ